MSNGHPFFLFRSIILSVTFAESDIITAVNGLTIKTIAIPAELVSKLAALIQADHILVLECERLARASRYSRAVHLHVH
jgi:predicted methyltransferase MtxX (methanogen marker protein 4)